MKDKKPKLNILDIDNTTSSNDKTLELDNNRDGNNLNNKSKVTTPDDKNNTGIELDHFDKYGIVNGEKTIEFINVHKSTKQEKVKNKLEPEKKEYSFATDSTKHTTYIAKGLETPNSIGQRLHLKAETIVELNKEFFLDVYGIKLHTKSRIRKGYPLRLRKLKYCGKTVGALNYPYKLTQWHFDKNQCRCDGKCGPTNGCQCHDCYESQWNKKDEKNIISVSSNASDQKTMEHDEDDKKEESDWESLPDDEMTEEEEKPVKKNIILKSPSENKLRKTDDDNNDLKDKTIDTEDQD
eukprot:UN23001